MKDHPIDILAFGAHADDVEIGMGAAIAKYAHQGKKIIICDLTKAELSSNGTVEMRQKEAKKAAEILGVSARETLALPDRGLFLTSDYINVIVELIRKYKPKTVFAPFWEDRHPDHGNCARLVDEAVFSAGIRKYEGAGEAHKVKDVYYYLINSTAKPDFIIDVSDYMDKKVASLNAYRSQFIKDEHTVDTPLVNGYIEMIQAREKLNGTQAGVLYAEGFITKKPLVINSDLFGD
ncbi:bacillithiol biosynthesis deacetylase BshB1 [Cytobacillus gottheilii]|uniref:bacillithiol biosynthesis deacetylase BshB1 n=1 Tax=Cytobacillus gottheilii TaxID=859144 RepID=UPI0009B9E0ED|nr:bacillithiol biosynthesis deacetylase BshB1 [Cytobacillus gottheilii]